MAIIGTYQGVAINSGTDKDVAAQMAKIDSNKSSSTASKNPAPAPTKPSASGKNNYDNMPLRNEEVAIRQGDYGMAAAEDLYNQERNRGAFGTAPEPRLDNRGSAGLASQYGLKGMNDKDFVGLTVSQAMAKARELQTQKQATVSPNTSFAFTPQTIAGFKNKIGDMKLKMDSINNDAWSNSQEKKDKVSSLINSFSDQLAGFFNSPEQLQAAMQDPNFKKSFGQYQGFGGDIANISGKIGNQVTVTNESRNPDGSYNVTYSDGAQDTRRYTQNADGTYTSNEAQTIDQYLGNISDPNSQKAMDSLIPEKNVYQAQIAFEQSIPEQYKAVYFGTEDQVGIIQQQRKQMEEEIKLLERKAKLDEKNMRAQADFAINKNNAELAIESNKVEENRLAAKNYMTGMLAKLGALNTTGEAPKAVATLEQKYQQQAQQLRTSYDFQNQEINIKLNENIDSIEYNRDSDILKAKGDLSKSEQDVWKEIFKLQNDADRKTFSIIEKYTGDFTSARDKYAKEAKTAAEKYMSEFGNLIGAYDFETFVKGKEQKNLQSLVREPLIPEFLQSLIGNRKISSNLKDVIQGQIDLTDLTEATQSKVRSEMRQLGINNEMLTSAGISSATLPKVGDLLSEAKAAIDSGKDSTLVKQRFLEAYPEKNASWNAYFGE